MGTIPSVLIETAFLSNKEDAKLLASPAFRTKMAAGIAKGIDAFQPPNFLDLTGHWGRKFIISLNEQGMLEGMPISNNFFKPNQPITRAEFMTVMDKLFPFSARLAAGNTIDIPGEADGLTDQADSAGEVIQEAEDVKFLSEDILGETDTTEQGHIVLSDNATELTENENPVIGEDPQPTPTPEIHAPQASPVPESIVFSDLLKSHWAYQTLINGAVLGFMRGYPDGTVRPDQPITRAEVVVLFNKVWDRENSQAVEVSGFTHFTDVPANSWFAKSVKLLNEASVIKGITEDTFSPDRKMTRAEMAAMVDNFMKKNK
ncbi:MAG TPA: S-layer homology domain-containing protein, partial [Bacilli bacterium]